MRAAVTGATGFVGSHLVDALLARGQEVTCLVRAPSRGEPLRRSGCRIVMGDLEAEPALGELCLGTDVVYHVGGAVAAQDEGAFLRVNRDGTRRVAEAAARAGVRRLVYVSSLSVTGPTVPGRPLDESAPPRPLTPYGRSKQAGEEAVRASGAPFTIVRPPVVYGPRDRELLRIFRMAARGLGVLLGDGSQELSLIHAADLARAILAAGTPAATEGRLYHAAGAERVSQRALVEAIGRAVGRRVRLLRLPGAAVRAGLRLTGMAGRLLARPTVLIPEKAEELLAAAWTCTSEALARDAGWRPEVPLETGLAETARWYRAEGWL